MLSFILSLCRILQLLTPFTLALTLPPTRDITNPSQSVPPINKTLPGPAALILESELASNYSSYAQNANPVCDGGLLGFDVNRYSCLQAWNMIPNDPQQLTFGDRLSGTFDVQLPRRFSGREFILFFPQQKHFEVCVDQHKLALTHIQKRTLPALSMSFTRTVLYQIRRPINRSHGQQNTCMVIVFLEASAPKVAGSEI